MMLHMISQGFDQDEGEFPLFYLNIHLAPNNP